MKDGFLSGMGAQGLASCACGTPPTSWPGYPAMAREILDVRRAAKEVSNDPTKYNEAIQEMLDYAKRSGQLPARN